MDKLRQILKGIDEDECETDDGWWETVGGAKFGAFKLAEVEAYIKENLPRWVPVSEQEPDKSKPQIVMFKSGIVNSAKYRKGWEHKNLQPNTVAWRCDCCDCFADPIAWLYNVPAAATEAD
ncbi:MAG: hypothetical protein DRI24_24150 [Deltaproteobacteria bacterium]|nr:MAG: hypothetical protein DRI24_24150 [Deltaproteobacteria bacterium]